VDCDDRVVVAAKSAATKKARRAGGPLSSDVFIQKVSHIAKGFGAEHVDRARVHGVPLHMFSTQSGKRTGHPVQ